MKIELFFAPVNQFISNNKTVNLARNEIKIPRKDEKQFGCILFIQAEMSKEDSF